LKPPEHEGRKLITAPSFWITREFSSQ